MTVLRVQLSSIVDELSCRSAVWSSHTLYAGVGAHWSQAAVGARRFITGMGLAVQSPAAKEGREGEPAQALWCAPIA